MTKWFNLVPVMAVEFGSALIVKPGIEAMTMFRRAALRVNCEIGQTLACCFCGAFSPHPSTHFAVFVAVLLDEQGDALCCPGRCHG